MIYFLPTNRPLTALKCLTSIAQYVLANGSLSRPRMQIRSDLLLMVLSNCQRRTRDSSRLDRSIRRRLYLGARANARRKSIRRLSATEVPSVLVPEKRIAVGKS